MNVGFGVFERYDFLREELLVLNAWATFCLFLFSVRIEKNIWFGTKSTYYVGATYKSVKVIIDSLCGLKTHQNWYEGIYK